MMINSCDQCSYRCLQRCRRWQIFRTISSCMWEQTATIECWRIYRCHLPHLFVHRIGLLVPWISEVLPFEFSWWISERRLPSSSKTMISNSYTYEMRNKFKMSWVVESNILFPLWGRQSQECKQHGCRPSLKHQSHLSQVTNVVPTVSV